MRALAYSPGSPFARAVRIVLHELELAFEPRELTAAPAERQGEAETPTLQVPVLLDGSLSLWESGTICEYLLAAMPAGRTPHPRLPMAHTARNRSGRTSCCSRPCRPSAPQPPPFRSSRGRVSRCATMPTFSDAHREWSTSWHGWKFGCLRRVRVSCRGVSPCRISFLPATSALCRPGRSTSISHCRASQTSNVFLTGSMSAQASRPIPSGGGTPA